MKLTNGERIMLALVAVLFAALFLAACSNTQADRATYDAVAPEYTNYVEHDAALSDEQRHRRMLTVETWRLRVRGS